VNDYAPEHLEILTDDPFSTLNRISNAGEILLGPYTPIPTSNYCLGLKRDSAHGRPLRGRSHR